jgi:hypothetical protein
MIKSIKSAVSSGHGNAILYAGAIGLLLSDVIPTPADGLYFSLMQKNKAKLQANEITPKQYWTRDAVLYYSLNPLWWSIILGAMIYTKGNYTKKAKVGLGILATGVVLSVLHKNIKKDEELMQKKLTT